MVRVLAESNEDVYRVLHFYLRPLARRLGGMEPYRDRIHSSRTVVGGGPASRREGTGDSTETASRRRRERGRRRKKGPYLRAVADRLVFGEHRESDDFDDEAWFRLCALSDSSLPVGSLVHSLGIEAA